jgi:Zn-dependent peptidase ImmA (M78 family)
MNNRPHVARRTLAENTAHGVLREMKIEGLHVDPEAIATAKGIVVKPKPNTSDGVSGMLVKAGDEFGIMYATNIPSSGFQRFSVAHEIGHYCISGHVDALMTSGVHYSHAGFHSADPFEQEADYFAAALLMPEMPFKKAIDDHPVGLACIEALRKVCDTSLTATAIRYAGLTRDGVAVILSTGVVVDGCFMSEGLKHAKGLSWLRKGTAVPTGTVTESFNARPENIRQGQKATGDGDLRNWMDGERRYNITEEVVGLGQYGRTLTVLACKNLTSRVEVDANDDAEEELIESWTPRFRGKK